MTERVLPIEHFTFQINYSSQFQQNYQDLRKSVICHSITPFITGHFDISLNAKLRNWLHLFDKSTKIDISGIVFLTPCR